MELSSATLEKVPAGCLSRGNMPETKIGRQET